MAKYNVTFIRYDSYCVEANSDSEAENKAYEEWVAERKIPIAETCYDEVEVEELDED